MSSSKIIDQMEAFAEVNGDLVFSHNQIIYTDGNDLFHVQTSSRVVSALSLEKLVFKGTVIPPEEIYPAFPSDGSLLRAPTPLPESCYLKRAILVSFPNTGGENIRKLVLQEAAVCETLSQSPNPNIAQYFGCKVENDKIVGLVFAKYEETLADQNSWHKSNPKKHHY